MRTVGSVVIQPQLDLDRLIVGAVGIVVSQPDLILYYLIEGAVGTVVSQSDSLSSRPSYIGNRWIFSQLVSLT